MFHNFPTMSSIVCCATLEVKYRKVGGDCKVVKDSAVLVSEIDTHLNEIASKNNFETFVSVKITAIHMRPLHSADSDDSDSEGEVEEVETSGAPHTIPFVVEQQCVFIY